MMNRCRGRKWLGVLSFAALLLILAACGSATTSGEAGGTASSEQAANNAGTASSELEVQETHADWPKKIALGVLPGEEEGELSRGNQILVDDLSEALGIDVELFVGEDYTAVIEAMRTGNIDIASFGPFSYIIAAERSGAEAFAIRGKSLEDAFYNSWIVVPDESEVQTLAELEGKNMLFADPASTSGHLFPRMMFVKELGISNDEIESFFGNVSFSGSHDNSIIAIAHGDADAAGVCSSCVLRAAESGLVSESDWRIIKESDPIPSDPMAYRKDLPEDLKAAIKDFFYAYDNTEFFEKGGDAEERYLPVEDSHYNIIRDTADALQMGPDDLLNM